MIRKNLTNHLGITYAKQLYTIFLFGIVRVTKSNLHVESDPPTTAYKFAQQIDQNSVTDIQPLTLIVYGRNPR